MAYRIEYNYGDVKKFAVITGRNRKNKALLVIIVLVTLGCITLHSLGRDRAYEALLPGDAAATKAAANIFVEELRGGTSLTDAFACFCREIIHNATY